MYAHSCVPHWILVAFVRQHITLCFIIDRKYMGSLIITITIAINLQILHVGLSVSGTY